AGFFSGLVSDLIQLQESGKTVLYASDVGTGVWRNDGSGWKNMSYPTSSNGFQSMRLAGSTQPKVKVYVSTIDNSTPNTLVSRYVTSNQAAPFTWTQLTWPAATGATGLHRFRHNVLAVDPANSSHVYVNTDIEQNLVPNNTEWVFLSTNSGQTW